MSFKGPPLHSTYMENANRFILPIGKKRTCGSKRDKRYDSTGLLTVKFAHAIARVLEGVKIWAGRGATFGTGVTAPFVASLPAVRSGAPTSLCRGGCDRGIVAASSVP
jgi:hypothetical protein